ncbi:hypothetical protein [Ktedonospora formicarum]|uniref:Uncharacterized protein n=1 Tax=Ktedonospora formicarum TaxID=2778364 RepID=A0A8J3HZL5_9CHLR|nr:hypothetical protein [Ktedonospora formicarum]GHO46649.1 hypothetical protein KSX_48120 [Ktedonospora formicarum]
MEAILVYLLIPIFFIALGILVLLFARSSLATSPLEIDTNPIVTEADATQKEGEYL